MLTSVAVRQRRHRAQAMVEFAAVLPIFMLLMIAIFDGARMLFSYLSLTNATRDMARTAVISTKDSTEVANAFRQVAIVPGEIQSTDSVCVFVTPSTDLTSAPPSTRCGTGTSWVVCPMNDLSSCAELLSASSNFTGRSAASGGYVDI